MLLKTAKRLVIFVVGGTVLLIGVAGVALPFVPAVLIVPVGLAILGTEFVWARRLLRRIKQTALNAAGMAGGAAKKTATGRQARAADGEGPRRA